MDSVTMSLELFCQSMMHFHYDKAKEAMDKQRDQLRSSSPALCQLFQTLSQITLAEKQFANLQFLLPRGFLRKDNSLKRQFDTLLQDLTKLSSASGSGSGSGSALLAGLVSDLKHYVHVRLKLMDFYQRACQQGQNVRHMELDGLTQEVEAVEKFCAETTFHDSLKGLFSLLVHETGILSGLFGAMQFTGRQTNFLQATIKLTKANQLYRSWSCQVQEAKDSSRNLVGFSLPLLFSSGSAEPALFAWLGRLRAAVVAKFSFYFRDILAKQAPPAEMKANTDRLSVDFNARLQQFLQRLDATNIFLILDGSNEPNFRGFLGMSGSGRGPNRGRGRPERDLRGKGLYPTLYSLDADADDAEAEAKPKVGTADKHLPNIIMILNSRERELDEHDRIVQISDHAANSTYLLRRIDPRVTLVTVLPASASKKLENEASLVNSMLADLVTELRFNKLLASLKPGTKAK